jgi:hypothetical protein
VETNTQVKIQTRNQHLRAPVRHFATHILEKDELEQARIDLKISYFRLNKSEQTKQQLRRVFDESAKRHAATTGRKSRSARKSMRMSTMFSSEDLEGIENVDDNAAEARGEESMDFEKFYSIVTDGTHQRHSRVVSDLVNETIKETVTFAFLEVIQWQYRMAFYSSSFLGCRLILDMPLVKPKRSTLEALKALSIFKQSALSATSGKTTVHSVALWLVNVASDDERSFFQGFCSLLCKLRLDLQSGNQGCSLLQDAAADDEDDLPQLPLSSALDSSEPDDVHGDTHLRAIRNVRSDSDQGQGIEMQERVAAQTTQALQAI